MNVTGVAGAIAAAMVVAACGVASTSTPPQTPTTATPAATPTPTLARTPTAAAVPSQDEILAAIQKGMNDLVPASQQCWARAATERFDIEGELEANITVDEAGAQAELHVVGNLGKLPACMKDVIVHYPWAPPLRGQTFRLPFKFTAPDSQSVIDRRLVDEHAQGNIAVRVLLDENNTNNAAASMFEVAIQAGDTGFRHTDRAELWYFLDPAEVARADATWQPVAAGDMMYVQAMGLRGVRATATVHAVIVEVPGGREGTARAGALPASMMPAGMRMNERVGYPLRAANAKTYGPATIFVDPTTAPGTPFAASILQLPAGAHVAEHVHAHETEMLYMLAGSGTMTVAGTQIAITPTSVIQIPPNTPHAVVATEAMRALQIYTPAGPEQRFKKP